MLCVVFRLCCVVRGVRGGRVEWCSVFCVVSRDVANECEEPMKRVPKCRQSDEQVLCVCVVLCGARCVMCNV